MFNFFFSSPNLFGWLILSFFLFLAFRKLLIQRTAFVVMYHFILFLVLFTLSVGGGGVQNDGYRRLEQFISLEINNQLQHAKDNPQEYDGMFQIDLQQFKNSVEFKEYLSSHDLSVDKAETLLIAWLLALIADISIAAINILQQRRSLKKKHIHPS